LAGARVKPPKKLSHSSLKELNMELIKLLWRDETGLELSEYAVSAALVVLPIVLAFSDLGDRIAVVMNRVTNFIAP